MPAVTAEELAGLNAVRAAQGRPPLAAHEVERLTYTPEPGTAALPPPTAEEAAALAYLRTRRAADDARAAAPVTQAFATDMSEDEALGYLRGAAPGPAPAAPAPGPPPTSRPHQVPAAPAPHAASGLAGLVVGGGPLSDHERAELAQMDSEHREDGRGPLTADKAASIVAKWRARAAA